MDQSSARYGYAKTSLGISLNEQIREVTHPHVNERRYLRCALVLANLINSPAFYWLALAELVVNC